VDVDVGIVVAVSVGGRGVCVAVNEGVTGVNVTGIAVNPDGARQPTRKKNSNNHRKKSLDDGCIIVIMRRMGDLLGKDYNAPPVRVIAFQPLRMVRR